MPGVPGPAEEHDLPMRARHVPDVRRPHRRVPHLPQAGREADPALLSAHRDSCVHRSPPTATGTLSHTNI